MFFLPQETKLRKLEKAVAVRKFLAGKVFRANFDTAGKFPHRFSGSTKCYPCQGLVHFPARKTAAGKLAAPAGTLLDFLLRDRHSLLELF